MQIKGVLFTLPFLSAVLASPAPAPVPAPVPASVPIGYGQQLQNGDQANHWVVWIEGQSACPNSITLSKLTESPCNIDFSFNGGTYHLADCGSDNEPRSVVQNGGSSKSCSRDNRKITCHNSIHDIVKHGKCT
ncbi:uncharacterized protein BDW43DRAFT_306682 [Aspergillus alliaceus]|uniref:uncharacterized protein n=1 Tax=Petromyces alliaceus TaxID=209559 RepID=UPI0012A631F6|nr:uncharacterized protein BDW43DRAFT_306682 [Aspergillus alliaceus]KAB8237976.1 hypothetical protein BDW43DRAFT_306682 [Aspergillus alliaceus]